jgi:glycosyltransferase involved in cell wall biosynthesis
VASILSALDVLLIPSLTEGHPLTLLEAFATATPVVSSSAGGLGEAIDDGETALLVPPRDPAAMAAAALRVLADPALAARLGSNARAEAERRYDMQLAVDRLVALYDRLLDGASGPA